LASLEFSKVQAIRASAMLGAFISPPFAKGFGYFCAWRSGQTVSQKILTQDWFCCDVSQAGEGRQLRSVAD
jgi:hypothetical protein